MACSCHSPNDKPQWRRANCLMMVGFLDGRRFSALPPINPLSLPFASPDACVVRHFKTGLFCSPDTAHS